MPADPLKEAGNSKEGDSKPAAQPTAPQNGNDGASHPVDTATATKNPLRRSAPAKQSALRQELEMLHKEMEVAQYGKSKAGQARRVMPRHLSTIHTKRRRALERIDRKHYGQELTERAEKRLRGSMAAVEEDLVRMSQVFPNPSRKRKKRKGEVIELEDSDDSDQEDDDKEEEAMEASDVEDADAESENGYSQSADSVEEEDGSYSDTDAEGKEEDGEESTENAESDEDDEDESADGKEEAVVNEQIEKDDAKESSDIPTNERDDVQAEAVVSALPKQPSRSRMGGRKKLYRMRNFKSYKLAQRHGEALGFLVRGQPHFAVSKLKQLAKELPKAPQIYSSLGLIYEDMLRTLQRDNSPQSNIETQKSDKDGKPEGDEGDSIRGSEEAIGDEQPGEIPVVKSLNDQLQAAKKAYGGYHAAALLCKRDYTLWIRAADMALEVADIHSELMRVGEVDTIEKNRPERRRWLAEAKKDLSSADKLKPTGIEITGKLASVLMELGMYSEALTLMTDMKNRLPDEGGRSDFDKSYNCWLLYSELMLRIGFECSKWNKGDTSNENYMFRRWMRKWSKTFDWEERRLQAFVKALEAAAGSSNCMQLVGWFHSRLAYQGESVEITIEDEESKEQDKEVLEIEKKNALEDFSKTTNDLELEPDSEQAKEREEARAELVRSLDVQEMMDQTKVSAIARHNHDFMLSEEDMLPISASASTVCQIASDLMKCLLEKELFEGARLVGESVSLYFKGRAAMRDRRAQLQRRLLERQRDTEKLSVFEKATYDNVEAADYFSDSDAEPLSDDDNFDENESDAVTEMFRKGILPPSLLFLHGLALAGLGGKDFIAAKCIKSILNLELEDLSSLKKQWKPNSEESWDLFVLSNSGGFLRCRAFAFAAHIILRLKDKGKIFLDAITSLFTDFSTTLKADGILDSLKDASSVVLGPLLTFRKQLIVSAFNATVALKARKIQANLINKDAESFSDLLMAVQTLLAPLSLTWEFEHDRTLSTSRLTILRTVSSAFSLLLSMTEELDNLVFQERLMTSLSEWVSLICFGTKQKLLSRDPLETADFANLPLSAQWLSSEQYGVSLRCHNLAISRNVTHFSGFEEDEFGASPKQVQPDGGPSFYGISTSSGHVSGYLSPGILDELTSQWDMLSATGRVVPSQEIASKLFILQTNRWYTELEESIAQHEKEHQSVCRSCEDEALSSLLTFSRLSLILVGCSSASFPHELYLRNALSILIPLAQFCSGELFWKCRLGTEAMYGSPQEWRKLLSKNEKSSSGRTSEKSRRRPKQSVDDKNKFSVDCLPGESASEPLTNLIYLPGSILAPLWKGIATSTISEQKDSSKAMENLHRALLRLRKCFTIDAAERASLRVSALLLEVARHCESENGFLCLNQAALYAGQGSKKGDSDKWFSGRLPEKELCTAHEALIILGRADCLQAVQFYEEAGFLCGFVVSVVAMHRVRDKELASRQEWKVVSLMAYNTSVLLRDAVTNKTTAKSTFVFEYWDATIKHELARGREIGLSWGQKAVAGEKILLDDSSIDDTIPDESSTDKAESERQIEPIPSGVQASLPEVPVDVAQIENIVEV